MPTLHWIGKEKVINHHLDVPYRVLEHQYSLTPALSGGEGATTQLIKEGSSGAIIHGDNLEALKALLPEYEGKIKCIYIDPPYNTGNEGWVYNDNVNDPKIKRWLGQLVGREEDDLTRHDKWLCMMYPRLKLLHKLLSDENGVIFISIDDNELANLKVLTDEIFGLSSFVEYFSWIKTSTAPSLANKSRKTTEYILCYEKKKSNVKYKAEVGDGGDAPLLNTGNPSVELVFPKKTLIFKIKDGFYRKGEYDKLILNNDINIKDGFADNDIKLVGEFKWTQGTLDEEIINGTSFIIKSEKFSIRYLREIETFKAPTNLLKQKYFTPLVDKKDAGVETNEGAKKEIFNIFGKHIFNYPKPVSLIEFFLKFNDDKNSIILDSFAGSGTTAHAVLNLNKLDGGNRKFICIEMEDYAETITAERVKRVINGYGFPSTGGVSAGRGGIEGTGGSFDYYELGPALFNEDNEINELVGVEKLRQYIYYTETKESLTYVASTSLSIVTSATPSSLTSAPLSHQSTVAERNALAERSRSHRDNEYLLSKHNDTAYYFYYEQDMVTTLNHDFLSTIKTKAEQYVIYADNCLLTKEFMMKHHIIFKKIPRDITKF